MHRRILDRAAAANEIIVVAAAAIDIVVTFVSSAARYVLGYDLSWAADLSTILLAIIAFLGAPAYFRRGSGMAYTAFVDAIRGNSQQVAKGCGLWATIVICLFALWGFPAFFNQQKTQMLPVLGISTMWTAVWIGLGFALFIVYSLEKLTNLAWRNTLVAFGITVVLGMSASALEAAYDNSVITVDPFIPVLIFVVVAFVTAMPVALILALAAMLYILLTGAMPVLAIPLALQAGMSSYVLLAIPFFMLAGTLMEITGMANRLIEMVQEWIGHWRGGLLVAQVVAMYIFSGVSGSKSADVATVGTVMKTPLQQYGYPPSESAAVLAASAAMGETVPPSLGLLIVGSITTLSVGSLFIAGIIPAAVLALVLMVTIVIRSRQKQWHRGPPFHIGRALRSIPPALPALMVPVIVIGGIVGGVASPTEASSFAVVYSFLVAFIVYRSIGLRAAWHALLNSALTAGMVLFMIATANLLSQTIVIDGLGRQLTSIFSEMQDPTIFLFLSMAVVIILGGVLEGIPAFLISAPILLPEAERVGVDPLQFGILLTMAVGIGFFMPPIGIGYYIACTVGGASVNGTMKPSALYNVVLVFGLCLVILFPQITLFLPHLLGFH